MQSNPGSDESAASALRSRPLDGQDWTALFLLLDAALELETAGDRQALLAAVARVAPMYRVPLQELLSTHEQVSRSRFMDQWPVRPTRATHDPGSGL